MSVELEINNNLTDEEKYQELLPQLEALIDPDLPVVSNLANVSAALKEAFPKISWVGFYLSKNDKLFLGPFQGKIACSVIEFGKGVCGTAAASKETIIVSDVNKFPGHIACDSGSKSEIVIPLISSNIVFGVLDLDSYEYESFNQIDKIYLEKLAAILISKIDFNNLRI